MSLAGASLAAVSDKFPSSNAAFWDHIGIAKTLHHIKKVIVVDHRDCGAYKVAYGKDYQGEGAAETAQHKGVMEQVKAKLAKLHPELESEFYLMALDGKAERVVLIPFGFWIPFPRTSRVGHEELAGRHACACRLMALDGKAERVV